MHAGRVAQVAQEAGVALDALEASARWCEGDIRGGRVMIERVDRRTALDLLASLPVALDPASRLTSRSGAAPLIVGWDTLRTPPVAKIYLNLSDASPRAREGVAATLGLHCAPHVIGLNMAADSVERKIYEQVDELPRDTPDALKKWARHLELAGVVRCFDVQDDGAQVPRAVFVAPRETRAPIEALSALPGWDRKSFDEAIPYEWGQLRSVGFAQDGQSWVAYVKPRDRNSALWTLEPVVCVRCIGGELGIYVVPNHLEKRAFARTDRYALSYRVCDGAPRSEEVVRVMSWASAVVARSEAEGAEAPRWSDPPRGCHVIR
jgi:hypothetical protein